MTPAKQTNLSLDDEDRERLERVMRNTGWSRTEAVRQALVALELGLDDYFVTLKMGYRGKGEVPDDEQQAVYRRVIQEMGYKAAIAVPSFGRSGPGDGLAYVEIEGFRYSLNQKRLVAIRESVHDGAAYFELFDVRQGGLRPRLRTRAGGC